MSVPQWESVQHVVRHICRSWSHNDNIVPGSFKFIWYLKFSRERRDQHHEQLRNELHSESVGTSRFLLPETKAFGISLLNAHYSYPLGLTPRRQHRDTCWTFVDDDVVQLQTGHHHNIIRIGRRDKKKIDGFFFSTIINTRPFRVTLPIYDGK